MALLLADSHFPVLGLAVPQFGETIDPKMLEDLAKTTCFYSFRCCQVGNGLELGMYEV